MSRSIESGITAPIRGALEALRQRSRGIGCLLGIAAVGGAGAAAVVSGQEAESAYAVKGPRTIQQPRGVLGTTLARNGFHSFTARGSDTGTIDAKVERHYFDTCLKTLTPEVEKGFMDSVAGSGNDNALYSILPRGRSIGEIIIAKRLLKKEGHRLDLLMPTCVYPQKLNRRSVEPTIRVWIDRSNSFEDEVAEELPTAKLQGANIGWIALRMRLDPDNRQYFNYKEKIDVDVPDFLVFPDWTMTFGGESVFSMTSGSVLMNMPYGGPVNPARPPENARGRQYVSLLPALR